VLKIEIFHPLNQGTEHSTNNCALRLPGIERMAPEGRRGGGTEVAMIITTDK